MTTITAPVAPGLTREGDVLARTYRLAGSTHTVLVNDGAAGCDPIDWWRAHWASAEITVRSTTTSPLRVGELFGGPGGLMVGASRAAAEFGIPVESRFAVDLDAEAVEVYANNHGTLHPVSRSVTELFDYRVKGRGDRARFRFPPNVKSNELLEFEGLEEHVGKTDLLLAGPPCQGYSHLNNHTRHDDERNALYLSAAAAAIALDVRHVVIENVLGVARDEEGVVYQTVRLLEDAGFKVSEPSLVRAVQLGWPQNRKRHILVASRDVQPIPLDEVVEALAMPAPGVLETIRDLAYRQGTEHLAREVEVSDVTWERIKYLFEHDVYDLPLEVRPECHQDGTTYMSVYGRMRPGEPAPTITTGFSTMGRGRFVHPTEHRTINGLEAARLQGFPDRYDWTIGDGEDAPWNKITKWIGDAVPMPIGHAAVLSVLWPLAYG